MPGFPEQIFLADHLSWPWLVGGLLGAIILALLGHAILAFLVRKVASRTVMTFDNILIQRLHRPTQVIFVLMAVLIVLPTLTVSPRSTVFLEHLGSLGLIAGTTWIIVACINAVNDFALIAYPLDVKDNLEARQFHTRVRVLRRIVFVVLGILAGSAALMTFPTVRQLGASLLASAGLAGLVIGFAARPALSNLIAGIQLAFAQPIRIDDVVIIEGEWGWIEEIKSTFVVVRIWDLRRLVVPLSYFLEKPFQNWTRVSADLLGTVFLYTDYTVPVDEVRRALHQILMDSDHWDGKVWGLQVTNSTEQTMELRALMSAKDSGAAWDLRCDVREKLIHWLQQHYPKSLPKVRAEIDRSE